MATTKTPGQAMQWTQAQKIKMMMRWVAHQSGKTAMTATPTMIVQVVGMRRQTMPRTTAMRATKKLVLIWEFFRLQKNCEDNMIKTGKTAVADKDRDNASASKVDNNVQETHGNDEEAGPNDEGDSNVASNTVHDNKVVTSGDNGGIIRVREDDSDADNDSAGSGDEEAARNDDNYGDGEIPASLGILPIPKNCQDSVIITGNTAITEMDRNDASANDRDDDAIGPIDAKQGTCGGDEEARTDDEGGGNVARETDRDDKVVVLGEGGDDTRMRDDNDDSSSDEDETLKKTSDNSSSSLSDDSSLSSSTSTSSTKANNIEMDALAVRQGKASDAGEESSKESLSSSLSTRGKSLRRKMAARELSLTTRGLTLSLH
jgi:hypothetical protein